MLRGKQQRSVYRILDANANRLREGLRALEEYFRFVRESPERTRDLKNARHRFARGISRISPEILIRARNSRGDVGRKSSGSETSRPTPESVAMANLKRTQEAARVLEEYGKLVCVPAAESFKRMRFWLYDFEKRYLLSKK